MSYEPVFKFLGQTQLLSKKLFILICIKSSASPEITSIKSKSQKKLQLTQRCGSTLEIFTAGE
jgi:hypothetical protein